MPFQPNVRNGICFYALLRCYIVTMLQCYNVTMLHYPVIQNEVKDLEDIHVDAHEIFRASPQQLVFVTTFL